MNLIFKKLTIRNFLSFGNVPEEIDLSASNYRVIIGNNKDKSDSQDDANGSGKSSIYQAIHYALFGKSIGNKITLPSLINNVNKKNMVVTLSFSKDDVEYVIERGRSPVYLKLFKNNEEVKDESLGDSRDTQSEIERIIGITSDVFSQIVCLSCGVPVFLEQPLGTQKEIIEKILGIDVISKKIASLKTLITETKTNVNNEDFKYKTLCDQKQKTLNNVEVQLSELKNKKEEYEKSKKEKLKTIKESIKTLEKVDIEKEKQIFSDIESFRTKKKEQEQLEAKKAKLSSEVSAKYSQLNKDNAEMDKLKNIDFAEQREIFEHNNSLKEKIANYNIEIINHNNKIKEMNDLRGKYEALDKEIKSQLAEMNNIKDGICPFCGNVVDKDKTEEHRKHLVSEITSKKEELMKMDIEILEIYSDVNSFVEKKFDLKPTLFKSYDELVGAENKIATLTDEIRRLQDEIKKLNTEINDIKIEPLGEEPKSSYKSLEEVLNIKVTLDNYKKQLEDLKNEKNPYDGQEENIIKLREGIVEPDDTELNKLKDDLTHQELLLKLLNSPSSFIRKNILDKSLEFLNAKIKYYLIRLGSLHSVVLNNDMSMDITSMGLEYGYVSTGEMSRISLALNFAFRDVWESLNNCRINVFLFDEVLDKSGLDTSGKKDIVECLSSINDRNLLVVSHDEIIKSSTTNIITVVKEQGFSHIK